MENTPAQNIIPKGLEPVSITAFKNMFLDVTFFKRLMFGKIEIPKEDNIKLRPKTIKIPPPKQLKFSWIFQEFFQHLK